MERNLTLRHSLGTARGRTGNQEIQALPIQKNTSAAWRKERHGQSLQLRGNLVSKARSFLQAVGEQGGKETKPEKVSTDLAGKCPHFSPTQLSPLGFHLAPNSPSLPPRGSAPRGGVYTHAKPGCRQMPGSGGF